MKKLYCAIVLSLFILLSSHTPVYALADGYYMIQNQMSGLYLDISGGSKDGGAEAIIWSRPKKGIPTNQQFYIKNVGNGNVTISPRHSKLYLSYATDQGAPIVQLSSKEVWKLKKQADGWYKIINALSGMCFDVNKGSTKAGANVIIWTTKNSKDGNQKWQFLKVTN
jgi:hypothetical protein